MRAESTGLHPPRRTDTLSPPPLSPSFLCCCAQRLLDSSSTDIPPLSPLTEAAGLHPPGLCAHHAVGSDRQDRGHHSGGPAGAVGILHPGARQGGAVGFIIINKAKTAGGEQDMSGESILETARALQGLGKRGGAGGTPLHGAVRV